MKTRRRVGVHKFAELTRVAACRFHHIGGVTKRSLSFWPVSGRFGAPGACPAASGLRVLPGVPWEGTRRATQRHDGISGRPADLQSLDPYINPGVFCRAKSQKSKGAEPIDSLIRLGKTRDACTVPCRPPRVASRWPTPPRSQSILRRTMFRSSTTPM